MADLEKTFDNVVDAEKGEEAAVAFAGFLAPLLVKSIVEGWTSFDVYDELYGLAVILIAEMALDSAARSAQIGGGIYILNRIARRYNVQQKIGGLV